MKWVECDYCFLVTSDITRHLKIAHNTHSFRRAKSMPESLDHRPMGRCFYCGDQERLTSDHVIPIRMGRHFNRAWNRVPCCQWCNQKKGGLQLGEWLTKLAEPSHTHSKHAAILDRRDVIVTELMSRPELAKYPGWIGAHLISGGNT